MVSPPPKTSRVLLVVALATVTIFGGVVAAMTWWLRAHLRDEVLRREARSIQAVAQLQLGSGDTQLAEFGEEFVIDDLFAAVLKASELPKGVFAVQLFDTKGALRAAKPLAPDDAAARRWWPPAIDEAEARFLRAGSLEDVSPMLALQAATFDRIPLVDIAVPLRMNASNAVLAIARYWVDGAPVAAEFARMDRRLIGQAGAAFAGGALLMGIVLSLAFSRLAEAHRRLVEQSADLARANEELDFAAKTGALGAISAHLIHGLKNPLAGIEGFVAETAAGGPDATGEACRTAVETTQRLRALVNEVVTVLRDETDGAADYPVPVNEVIEAARQRAQPGADQASVQLHATSAPNARVSARTANLAGLVLANLLANAIEAAPPAARIEIDAQVANGRVDFIVRDTGPGLPDAVRASLFRPVRSAKRGGGGVGLAISYRLAKHAAGDLQLVRSDARGTEFRLSVPAL